MDLVQHSLFSVKIQVYQTLSETPYQLRKSILHIDIDIDIASHLTTLHAARKAFIELESSNKLKIALHKNTRSIVNKYNIGEEVFYKRNDSPGWKSPAKVLGQDRPFLSSEKVLDILKYIYAKFKLFKHKNLCQPVQSHTQFINVEFRFT